MKILFIGDIVARPGRETVSEVLPDLKREYKPDLVIANAENLAHGRGATKKTLHEMLACGVDFFTGGDHIFWEKTLIEDIDDLPLVRPANYPVGASGEGYKVLDLGKKGRILIINLLGRTFLNERLDDPFRKADEILDMFSSEDLAATIVDFHAEASSEKHALGFYLDGRVNAFIGTHTHVPTCDTRLLPEGTLYVTDVGMTGNIDSVLGVKTEIILELYLSAQNQRFEWESAGKKAFRGVIIDTAKKTIDRVDRYVQ